jgi:hypothetical protein
LVVGNPENTDLQYSSGWKNKVVVAPHDKVEWLDANNIRRIIIDDGSV